MLQTLTSQSFSSHRSNHIENQKGNLDLIPQPVNGLSVIANGHARQTINWLAQTFGMDLARFGRQENG